MIKVLREKENYSERFFTIDDLKGKIVGVTYNLNQKKRFWLSAMPRARAYALDHNEDSLCCDLKTYYEDDSNKLFVFESRECLFKWLSEEV